MAISRKSVLAFQSVILVLFVSLWTLATQYQWVHPVILAGPIPIAKAIWAGILSGELPKALEITALEVAVAFAIGGSAGLVIGLGGAMLPRGRESLYPVLVTLSSVPVFILFPLFVVWFGIGPPSKYAFGAVYAFFPVVLNSFAAVRGVDRQLLMKARALGASRWQIYIKVVLPAALPTIVVGLRIGVTYGFIGVVATEMIASYHGIGYLVSYYGTSLETDKTYGYFVVAILVAFLLNATLRTIELRASHWR
jgi:ABC-type nitrate/sulfonate/bicarbonate transport system permease component